MLAGRASAVDDAVLVAQRRRRLHDVLRQAGVAALLTSDPFTIRYATGSRNMTVHGLTGPDRFALVVVDGANVLWEFAGCEHLSSHLPDVDELRSAPAISAKKSMYWRDEVVAFAGDVLDALASRGLSGELLAVDRVDAALVDELRRRGIELADGTEPVQVAMAIKQPAEIVAMRAAMACTTTAAETMWSAIEPGRTEQEVWAEFHRALIAGGGEFVVTRLLQSGERTFPYFQEASAHVLGDGDLVCFDSDAVGAGGYSVDFSRTFACGPQDPSARQLELHRIALDQLRHNAANLVAGRSFADFARRAFAVAGPLQALCTAAATILVAMALGLTLAQATFVAFLTVLSSTAVVLKLYNDRRELRTPAGELSLGILLFQDLAMVPMVVVTGSFCQSR